MARIILRTLGVTALSSVMIAFFSAVSLAGDTKPAVRSNLLVSAEWLAQHLHDPNLAIIHIAEKRGDYDKGHIPGARFLATGDFVAEHKMPMAELPSVEDLGKVFSKLGIGDDTRVVLYTTDWFPLAARGYYTLDYLGHGDKTALLDGGIEQWTLEKRELSKTAETPKPADFHPSVHPEVKAMLDEVSRASQAGSANVQIVDSRPGKRYKDGHVPGAVNVYWKDTLVSDKSPVLLSPEKLQQIFEERKIAPGKKVITYCEVGLQASHGYFLAKYLGYDAAMYDGSWHEWEMMNHMPVVKGEQQR
ncbi:MAG TPA: sulfurtransferase [Terriglobales bacterium]